MISVQWSFKERFRLWFYSMWIYKFLYSIPFMFKWNLLPWEALTVYVFLMYEGFISFSHSFHTTQNTRTISFNKKPENIFRNTKLIKFLFEVPSIIECVSWCIRPLISIMRKSRLLSFAIWRFCAPKARFSKSKEF